MGFLTPWSNVLYTPTVADWPTPIIPASLCSGSWARFQPNDILNNHELYSVVMLDGATVVPNTLRKVDLFISSRSGRDPGFSELQQQIAADGFTVDHCIEFVYDYPDSPDFDVEVSFTEIRKLRVQKQASPIFKLFGISHWSVAISRDIRLEYVPDDEIHDDSASSNLDLCEPRPEGALNLDRSEVDFPEADSENALNLGYLADWDSVETRSERAPDAADSLGSNQEHFSSWSSSTHSDSGGEYAPFRDLPRDGDSTSILWPWSRSIEQSPEGADDQTVSHEMSRVWRHAHNYLEHDSSAPTGSSGTQPH